jgi:hypothetical protein
VYAAHVNEECVGICPFKVPSQSLVFLEKLYILSNLSANAQKAIVSIALVPLKKRALLLFLGCGISPTFTLLLALENWPQAIPKRKSGPKIAIQKRLNLSRNG